MRIEISKEQKANIAAKMSLCVEFLKTGVQSHLTAKDKVVVPANSSLELHITSDTLFIKLYASRSLGPIDIPFQQTYTLEKEKTRSKADKHYICEANPEAAIEFLKSWDNVKKALMDEVAEKIKTVDKINNFINDFKL